MVLVVLPTTMMVVMEIVVEVQRVVVMVVYSAHNYN